MNRTLFKPEEYGQLACMSFNNRGEYDAFCEYLDSIGKRWRSGDSYLELNNWDVYSGDTVCYFNEGTYGSLGHARNNGYTIVNYDQFLYSNDDECSVDSKVTLTFDQLWN